MKIDEKTIFINDQFGLYVEIKGLLKLGKILNCYKYIIT